MNNLRFSFCLFTLVFLFNHITFSQSSSNYTFAVASNGTFDDMTGSTTMVGPNQDFTTYTTAPFHSFSMDFLFMGEFWNEMKVGPSGVIWFGNATDFFPTGANTIGTINNSRRISAFAMNEVTGIGGDMRTHATGKIHYKEFGTAPNRHVTVEFLNLGTDINSTTADLTFQVKFYETNSIIELIYDQANASAANPGGVTAGFQIDDSNDNRLTIDVNDDSFSYNASEIYNPGTGIIANINTTTDGSRKIYTLESGLANGDASNVTSSCLGPYALRLDWTDNSTNEIGYVVYGSSDGGATFTRMENVGSNITNAAISGLSPSTSYIFRVYSHSEGQISTLNPTAQITTSTIADNGTIQSIASGNWNQGIVWSSGSVPNATKNVVIGCLSPHTVLVNVVGSTNELDIQSGSTLNYITTRGLNISGNATNAGTMNISGANSFMNFDGSFLNSGTFSLTGTNTTTNIAGDFTNSGSWNPGNSSTVSFDGVNPILLNHTGTVPTETTTTVSSGALGFAIPDGNFTWSTHTLNLAGPGTFALNSVTVDIDHTWNNDIDLFLQTPAGNFLRLSLDKGGDGDNYDNVTFIDSSPNTLPIASTNLTGTYQPENLFSTYTGTVTGNWTLYYRDDFGGDTGTLQSWSISFLETVNSASSYIPFHNLILNNSSAGGITLDNTNVSISGTLSLTDGILHTQDNNNHELIMNSGSISGASSNASHIDGPITKIGNTNFTFPVGDGGFSAAMTIDFGGAGNATDEFRCRYYNQSPNIANTLDPGAPYDITNKEGTLQSVNFCEYWDLDQQVNSGTALTVSLSYDAARSCGFTNPADLLVAHWTDKGAASNRWKNEGLGGVNATGIFNSVVIDTYSPFTLGATTIILPVEWVSFDALREENNVRLNWSAIENLDTDEYIVQRSSDGINFVDLEVINAIGEELKVTSYSYLDLNVAYGRSQVSYYYRIKQIDTDGEELYSKLNSVSFDENSISLNVFPNPFSDHIKINLYSEEGSNAILTLWTMDGKPTIEEIVTLTPGTNELTLPTQGLAVGAYYLKVTTGSSTYTVKLEKN